MIPIIYCDKNLPHMRCRSFVNHFFHTKSSTFQIPRNWMPSEGLPPICFNLGFRWSDWIYSSIYPFQFLLQFFPSKTGSLIAVWGRGLGQVRQGDVGGGRLPNQQVRGWSRLVPLYRKSFLNVVYIYLNGFLSPPDLVLCFSPEFFSVLSEIYRFLAYIFFWLTLHLKRKIPHIETHLISCVSEKCRVAENVYTVMALFWPHAIGAIYEGRVMVYSTTELWIDRSRANSLYFV